MPFLRMLQGLWEEGVTLGRGGEEQGGPGQEAQKALLAEPSVQGELPFTLHGFLLAMGRGMPGEMQGQQLQEMLTRVSKPHCSPTSARASLGINIPKHSVTALDAAQWHQSHTAQPKPGLMFY